MKRTFWIAIAALVLGGCTTDRVRLDHHGRAVLELDQVTDSQLRESGEWTEADARARQLIGPERGGMLGQYRPVRRPDLGQKLAGLSASVLTVCGWSYEKSYHYLPDERAYLFVHRAKPASIVSEAWQGRFGEDEPAPVLLRWGRPSPTPWPRSTEEEQLEAWTQEVLPRWLPPPPPKPEPIPISRIDLR